MKDLINIIKKTIQELEGEGTGGVVREQKREYEAPPEILDALKDKLRMDPLNRFIEKFKAINSIPPSYRVFLHNTQTFDIIYEQFSLLIKIGSKEYYIGDLDERNLAIKHINKLLTDPIMKPEDEEDEDSEMEKPSGGTTTPPPKLPTTPTSPPPGDTDDDM